MRKIDLEDTYDPTYVSEDLKTYIFQSDLIDGQSIEIHVAIREHPDEFLPNVYNLGFGPLSDNDRIDDKAILKHKNGSKVFSTVLLFGITFLQENVDSSIGIDGSDDVRAYLYHRMFRYNIDNLSDLVIVGVDWYVKLLRNQQDIERDKNGLPLFKPRPEPFDLNRNPNDLYRYYIFSLKK